MPPYAIVAEISFYDPSASDTLCSYDSSFMRSARWADVSLSGAASVWSLVHVLRNCWSVSVLTGSRNYISSSIAFLVPSSINSGSSSSLSLSSLTPPITPPINGALSSSSSYVGRYVCGTTSGRSYSSEEMSISLSSSLCSSWWRGFYSTLLVKFWVRWAAY